MNEEKKSKTKNNNASHHPNVLPATEIPQTTNSGAKKNMEQKTSAQNINDMGASDKVGSEITDGEDG